MFQVLALIPGTSRSGCHHLGAIMIGASRYVAAEFSFFLGIPTMFGASALKIFKFLKDGKAFDFPRNRHLTDRNHRIIHRFDHCDPLLDELHQTE